MQVRRYKVRSVYRRLTSWALLINSANQPTPFLFVPNVATHLLTGGTSMEIVSSYCHLGHIITSSLSDEQDIMSRRNAFISQVNSVLCHFGKLSSVAKARLFHCYCTSYYGCVLWDLSCSAVDDFCIAWRKGIRRILHVWRMDTCCLCYVTVCLFMMIFVWDLWILCVHVWRIRAPLWVLLHSTALCTDGLVHRLVVISNVVRNDMPALHRGLVVSWTSA